jgi:polyhydroxyalkanoate synthesis regulator protein
MIYLTEHLVTKQSSRKLYSHSEKNYTSLKNLLDKIVLEDHEITVVNKHEKKDITMPILCQALFQSQKEKIENGEVMANPKLVQEALRFLYDKYNGDLFLLLAEQMAKETALISDSKDLESSVNSLN